MSKFHSDYMITMKDIVKEGDPILRKKLAPVEFPVSNQVKEELACMLTYLQNSQNAEIAKKYKLRPGSGLSANQIGLNKRMFTVLYHESNGEQKALKIINPELISHSPHTIYLPEGEGCLSVDREILGHVPRYERIKIAAYDEMGEKHTYRFNGYSAILIQHEMDHLNGIMFYDHINKESPFLNV
ncbi:peptide deformylase [Gracilibacillus alcaliphilus]|uniref:peptide deformylase n=1 Tax=Gracilibacillus alcaliphilus TaxID=1401441 RepID=UPI00195CB6BA|nr:peptide deformylase [Gracilibacillus alcaliphilus]MBM7678485.1 peptide deformylase [Gracilibacillus alcaliphilus]